MKLKELEIAGIRTENNSYKILAIKSEHGNYRSILLQVIGLKVKVIVPSF